MVWVARRVAALGLVWVAVSGPVWVARRVAVSGPVWVARRVAALGPVWVARWVAALGSQSATMRRSEQIPESGCSRQLLLVAQLRHSQMQMPQ